MLSANESVLASRAVCLSVKRGFVKSVGVGLKQLCFRPVFPVLTLYKACRQRAVIVDSVKVSMAISNHSESDIDQN